MFFSESVQNEFTSPDHDLHIGEEMISRLLSAREPDKVALLFLGPIMLIATRVMSPQTSMDDLSDAELVELSSRMFDCSLREFLPELIAEVVPEETFQALYRSAIHNIHSLSLKINLKTSELIEESPESYVDYLVEGAVDRLNALAKNN